MQSHEIDQWQQQIYLAVRDSGHFSTDNAADLGRVLQYCKINLGTTQSSAHRLLLWFQGLRFIHTQVMKVRSDDSRASQELSFGYSLLQIGRLQTV